MQSEQKFCSNLHYFSTATDNCQLSCDNKKYDDDYHHGAVGDDDHDDDEDAE